MGHFSRLSWSFTDVLQTHLRRLPQTGCLCIQASFPDGPDWLSAVGAGNKILEYQEVCQRWCVMVLATKYS